MATSTGFNHTIAQQYRTQAGTVAEVTEIINGDSEVNVDETVPATTTGYQINVSVAQAAVISMALWAGGACTVRTNAASPGTDVFALVSTHPVLWNRNSAQTAPLTDDVTALYIDNPGSTAVRVRFSALLAAHPLA
jgi:hypothetical protein